MKHLLLAVFCLALFAGCKKKADQTNSITGKWKLKKVSGKNSKGNEVLSDTTIIVTDTTRFIKFNSDGTGTANVGVGAIDHSTGLVVSVGGNFTYKLVGNIVKFTFPGGSTADQTATRNNRSLTLSYELTFDDNQKYNVSGTSKISGEQYFEQ